MDEKHATKLEALTDVNGHIGALAAASQTDGLEWQFFCECGAADCEAHLMLTLAAYTALREAGERVLAPGHRVDQKDLARMLLEDARALHAQAGHQLRRATKNLGRGRAPDP